jgi:hypothetical protein
MVIDFQVEFITVVLLYGEENNESRKIGLACTYYRERTII